MSQAFIDFCEGLKSTLLALEERIEKAQAALSSGAARASNEAQAHIDEAAEHLQKFKAHASQMAEAVRADLPSRSEAVNDKLEELGHEAQVAMRHAVVFLAESASKGATGAAGALQAGAKQAQKIADQLRHDSALTVTPQDATPSPTKP
jgi:predicted nuclease with TOPRIM domain